MSVKSLAKKKQREEKKRHSKGKHELNKDYTPQERKKGVLGLYLIGGMAVLAAVFAFIRFSQL